MLFDLVVDLSDLHSCPQFHYNLVYERVLVLGLLLPALILLRVSTELHPVHHQLCDDVL